MEAFVFGSVGMRGLANRLLTFQGRELDDQFNHTPFLLHLKQQFLYSCPDLRADSGK